MDKLVAYGCIEESDGDANRLVKMLNTHGVLSLSEAAIRFCRHELNPDVVLSGTGDTGHLESNIAACQAGPLPDVVSAEFRRLFSKLNSLTGRNGTLSCALALAHDRPRWPPSPPSRGRPSCIRTSAALPRPIADPRIERVTVLKPARVPMPFIGVDDDRLNGPTGGGHYQLAEEVDAPQCWDQGLNQCTDNAAYCFLHPSSAHAQGLDHH